MTTNAFTNGLRGLAAALATAGLIAGPAAAQEEDPAQLGGLGIETLMDLRVDTVVAASRYEQTVSRAPASVTVLTRHEIRRQGYRTLADILRSVGGIYVTYDRNYDNMGLRGFGRPGDFNTRVLLLVDGHRLNDYLYDSALLGPEAMLDVDMIERVEVIRGPGSSVYGNNALLGVINVVTRKGALIDGLEISAASGTNDTNRGRATYGRQFLNGLEVSLSASEHDTAGNERLYYDEFDTPANNDGVSANNDSERGRNWYGSVAYHGLTLAAGLSQREKQVPTASFGTAFNDGREVTRDETVFVDLSYTRNVLVNTQFLGRLFYDRYGYEATYPFDFAAPGDPPFPVVFHDDQYGSAVGGEVQLTRRIDDRHTLVGGVELRQSLDLHLSSYSDDIATYYADDRERRSVGAYVQDEFTIAGTLTLNTGLRYDHYSNFGGALSPRVALVQSPWDGGTWKLMYGRAYRAPNIYEQYLESPGYSKANPELGPEKIATSEAAFEQYLTERLSVDVSIYRYDMRGLISQERDPADGRLQFRNRAGAEGEGIELGLKGAFVGGWSTRASYAYQRATDEVTGQQITNSPRHLAKAGVIAPVWGERLALGVNAFGASASRTIAGTETPGFGIVNATLHAPRVLPRLAVSASIYNALDRHYAYPGSTGHTQDDIPQDGRLFRLKATYQF